VIHCVSERQARGVRDAVARRLAEVGLELHPDKTRIVYCKDSNRQGTYEQVSFTFCSYMFRPRKAYNNRRRVTFTSFLPAVSPGKLTLMSRRVASWRIHRRVNLTLEDLAAPINQRLRGWLAYFTAFYPSAVGLLCQRIDRHLVEAQAAGAKRQAGTGVASRSPITGARAVRALAVLQRSGLTTGRHEPYEPRGSRADLWGPGGEIPPGYPAAREPRPDAPFRHGRQHRARVCIATQAECARIRVDLDQRFGALRASIPRPGQIGQPARSPGLPWLRRLARTHPMRRCLAWPGSRQLLQSTSRRFPVRSINIARGRVSAR
jgi:hypothetical protein